MHNHKNRLQEKLKAHGYSFTKTRFLIFQALLHEQPIDIKQLLEKLSGQIDRSSLYRNIALFEKIGVVEKLPIGWKYKLELTDSFNDHHHHITCDGCGQIETIRENRQLENMIMNLTVQSEFSHQSHQLEIRGLCQKCQS